MIQKIINFLHLFFGIRQTQQDDRLFFAQLKMIKFDHNLARMPLPMRLKSIDARINTLLKISIKLLLVQPMEHRFQKLQKQVRLLPIKKVKIFPITIPLMPLIPLPKYKK